MKFILVFLGVVVIIVGGLWGAPVGAEVPRPYVKSIEKRIKPPLPNATRRITVQIDPAEQARVLAAGIRAAQQAQDRRRALGRVRTDKPDQGPGYDWFWQTISPRLLPGPQPNRLAVEARLSQALAQLDDGPMSVGTIAPNLAALRRIAQQYGTNITRATQGGPVSPAVVIALIGVESSGQSGAVSPKGAGGLMQLIPETAARFGVQDRFDPAQNIAGGVAYLNWLMATFSGDPLMVLAGYNAGEGAVTRHNGVPPFAETRAYVPKVLAAWQVARSLCLRPPLSFQDGCVIADVAAKDQSLGANASAQSR